MTGRTCKGKYMYLIETFIEHQLYINYQFDKQIIIYSYNIIFLYMFRAINAHLQEVTLYTFSIWYRHSLWAIMVAALYTDRYTHSICELTGHHDRSESVTVPYAAFIQYDLLKMSIYGSKHVEECNIIWLNNNLCIKLVFNM